MSWRTAAGTRNRPSRKATMTSQKVQQRRRTPALSSAMKVEIATRKATSAGR